MLETYQSEYTKRFHNSSLPTQQIDESWRKFNFKNFQPESFVDVVKNVYQTSSNESYAVLPFAEIDSVRLKYIESLLKNWDWEEDFFSLASLSHLNQAVFVDVGANHSIEDSILVEHAPIQKSQSSFPVTIIRVGANSKLRIVERYSSQNVKDSDSTFQWMNSLTIIELGKNSKLEYVTEEFHSDSCYNFRTVYTKCWEDSYLKNLHFYLGGYRGKTRQFLELSGRGAEVRSLGITALASREFQDHETEIRHRADSTISSLLHKVIVRDNSHHIFTGNLHIPNGLKKVEASQVNHNLSLERSARAESIPKLEIFSEDVKSAHGSTVGEIDENQLFYLKSRGLDEDTAKHLLVEAFLTEILDEIGDTIEIEKIQSALKEKIWPTKK
jgi:FeS assembly protein SufD